MQPGSLDKSPASYFDVWTPGTFDGTESEWSSIQTITIPSNSEDTTTSNPAQSATITPTVAPYNPATANSNQQIASTAVPLTTYLVTVVICVGVIVALLIIILSSKRKPVNGLRG